MGSCCFSIRDVYERSPNYLITGDTDFEYSNVIGSISYYKRAEYITSGYIRLYIEKIVINDIKHLCSTYLDIIILSPTEISTPVKNKQIVLLGAKGVGKTALTMRILPGTYCGYDYDPTAENVYQTHINGKRVDIRYEDNDEQIEEETFTSIKYYQIIGTFAFLLVYDISSFGSFEHIKYLYQVLEKSGCKMNVALIGNKCDLSSDLRQITYKMGQQLANTWSGYNQQKYSIPFFETSAKDRTNIFLAFESVLKRH
eukprot:355221_1